MDNSVDFVVVAAAAAGAAAIDVFSPSKTELPSPQTKFR